nr:unnamed protein product [Callosobruchus chinensis]
MDDNARPHRTRAVQQALENGNIARLEWPAMSPGMNPIEHSHLLLVTFREIKSRLIRISGPNIRSSSDSFAGFGQTTLLVWVIGSLGGMRNTLLSGLRAMLMCRAAVHILAARMQKAVILGSLRLLRAHDTRTQ